MENFQKPNPIPNVALVQASQNQKPQEQKPAEQKEKKELSPRAKLIKDLNALVTKLKSIDKRETKAKNALEAAKNAVAKIEEERAEVEALAKKFELSNSTTA
ncbi:hypothetical protein [uncultured Campylobacter sp.]|uniref:hypothetical protein n=1 Tax=uncultured Campylobacter sp. TaxID=218934 RepID=UPI002630CEAA|nr:hypothetical protein [uncultured Campylobacter sp.]